MKLSHKLTLSFVIAITALIGVIAAAFYCSSIHYYGTQKIAGIAAPVHIVQDSHGVPHIFAETPTDAARALGYVHAGERLFQMEMQRRAGQGRLSEVIGTDGVGIDKYIRTLGLYHLAESSAAAMSPEAQAYFQAYADGVNAWLDGHHMRFPPEFYALDIHPEPWRVADSVVWGKLMGLQLSKNYKYEMLRAALAKKLPPEQVNVIFAYPEGAPVTTEPKRGAGVRTQDSESHCCNRERTTLPPLAVRDINKPTLSTFTSLSHAASNEWVISGGRTQSGKPILANDPHLDLSAPILWYLARMVTPAGEVKGATVPGLPIILLGQNDHIAWGFTTTGSDVQDLFIETVDPKNANNYLTPQGSKPFITRQEIIHVKGVADIVLTVRATRHGPVMSDIDDDMTMLAGKGKVMALAFTALGANDTTSEALLRMNRAQNYKEFLDALRLYQAPPQNVVYADTDGHVGYISPGLLPIRKAGKGLFPADGSSGKYDWSGMILFEKLPQVFDPTAGFIFNANNAIVGTHYPYFIGVDWEEPYRAERLQHFFDTIETHTLDASAMMQADHVSLAAKKLLPYLTALNYIGSTPDNPRAEQAIDLLKHWDGTMDKDRPEPLIFEAWLYELHRFLLTENAENDLEVKGPYDAVAMESILKNQKGEVIAQAFDDAITLLTQRRGADIKNWRWGDEHITQLRHKFYSHIPLLDTWSNLDIASSGDFYTLDRGGSGTVDPANPFARTHGGGFRGIYDLGDSAQSRFMITTGQSGNIFSPHYGDFVSLWNDVKSFTLSGTRDELTEQGNAELTLLPH
jgi:penicillin amidase